MKSFSRGGGFGGGFGGGRQRPSFGGGARRDEDRELFSATCASCGTDCQVPFRPNGRKPVLCSSCFRTEDRPQREERRSFGGDRGGDRFERRERAPRFSREEQGGGNDRLGAIEAKLDVILSQLRRLAREEKHETKSSAPTSASNDISPELDTFEL